MKYLVTYRGSYISDYSVLSVGSGSWQVPDPQTVDAQTVMTDEGSYVFYAYSGEPVAVIPVDQVQSVIALDVLIEDDEEATDS